MCRRGLDWFYPVRVLGTAAAVWYFWRGRLTRREVTGIWSGGAVAIGAAVFVVRLGLEWALGLTGESPAVPGALAGMPAGLAAAVFWGTSVRKVQRSGCLLFHPQGSVAWRD
jgi:hypothetical protein